MQILGKKMGSKRNIFEEVSGSETKVANSEIKTGIIEQSEHISDRRHVRSWLICLFILLFLNVFLVFADP